MTESLSNQLVRINPPAAYRSINAFLYQGRYKRIVVGLFIRQKEVYRYKHSA